MKRFLLCMVAAFSFVACVQSELDEARGGRGLIAEELVVGFDEGDTRIQLNELQKSVWNKGDIVSVFYKSYENLMWQFQGQTGDRNGVLKHVDGSVGEQVMSDVVIVYPYNSEYMVNLETKCVEAHMPATQQYHENSYDPAVNIMVACDDSRSFVLKNVCGWIKVSLTGNGESLKNITLVGNKAEQIAGDIVVDTDDATASFISTEGGSADNLGVSGGLEFDDAVITSITLDCEGVVLGSEAKNFYITLPPVTFNEGFTVAVECEGYEPMAKSVSSKVNIQRNHIHSFDAFNFEAEEKEPEVMGFTLENVYATYFDYTVDVIPDNKKLPYIMMSVSPEYIIGSGLETGEDYYEDDVAYFGWLGQFFGESAVQVMQERAKWGDQRGVTVSNCASGVPYTFYCYYFDYDSGELLSDVSFFTVETAKPELQEVEFNMRYEISEGCLVAADVVPIGYSGDYYFDILDCDMVNEYLEDFDFLTTEVRVIEYWWSTAVQSMMSEMSNDQILSEYTCVGNSYYEFELLANHDYYLFAFAMEENALCCSTPKVVKFNTGDVAMSDNVIIPSVTDVTTYTATLNFTTTNDDYYVAGYEEAALWETYGNSDAERMQYILEVNDYEFLSGNYSENVIFLDSDTEYVVYAFGSRGGVATTALSTISFKTKSNNGNVSISFKDLGYYDCAAVAQYPGLEFFGDDRYAGMVVFPYDVEFSSDEHGDFWYDMYNWTGRHESEYYTDEEYMLGMIWSMDTYGSADEQSYIPLEIGGEYELVAVVLDTEGNFSELYRERIRPTYDGCRDPEDFVEWYTLWQENMNDGPEPSSLVVNNTPEKGADADAKLSSNVSQSKRVSQMTFERNRSVEAVDKLTASRY
jgi:hypothetical protein